MELNLNQNSLRCYDCVHAQTVRAEATQEAVVPDTLPDIGEVVETTGTFMIRSKDISGGCVRVTGAVAAHVVYCAEDGNNVCSLAVTVPVALDAEGGIPDDAQCTVQVTLKGVDTRVLNPRKVLVRAELCAELRCYAPASVELPCEAAERAEELYTRTETARLSPVVSLREKTFVLSETLQLPAGAPSAREILAVRLTPCLEDVKAVGNKLVVKGQVRTELLYGCMDGGTASAVFTTPFSQLVDCDTDLETPFPWVDVMATGLYVELPSGGDGRAVEMEAHLLAQTLCRERKALDYLSDAYSNSWPLTLEKGEERIENVNAQTVVTETLREMYETPETVGEVLSAYALAGESADTSAGIDLPLTVYLLYRAGDGRLCGGRKKCTLRFALERGEGETLQVDGWDLTELSAAPAVGGIEIRLNARLLLTRLSTRRIETVQAINRREDESIDLASQPALVILRASSADDLWAIAKANFSTVEEIERVNDLASLGGNWERYLLVPRQR